jgi:hypothetical protein
MKQLLAWTGSAASTITSEAVMAMGYLGFGGDAAGASDRFARTKGGGGSPQEEPCSGEIAKLGHGNAAQCQCRRVIAQRDTVQGAKGITLCQGAGARCDQRVHSNPDTLVTPSEVIMADISTPRSTPETSRPIRQ